jgi:hypothetical protein
MNTVGNVLAYFLTWTIYGTWLSGDERGWIKKRTAGIQPPNWRLQDEMRDRMVEETTTLSDVQRRIVEETIAAHCAIREWQSHAVNARTNHVHVVVAADRDPDDVMNQLKAWCSRKLSDHASLKERVAVKAGRRHWFTEGGDKELIYDEDHLRSAIRYVLEGQQK